MNHEINTERIKALTEEYVQASSPKQREQVETKLLKETLWKALKESDNTPFAEYTEKELQILSEAIDEGNTEANRLIRRPYLKTL